MPDQVVTGAKRNITLGGTTLELNYVGKNHSDSTLVMRLPKEKIIFTVDWIPINGVQFRGMADNYLPDIEDGLKKVIAMDWERMIPGHPGPGGRLGTKDDARDMLTYLQDLSAAVKEAASQGKCYADAMRDIKLPKYESFPNYAQLPADEHRALLRLLQSRDLTVHRRHALSQRHGRAPSRPSTSCFGSEGRRREPGTRPGMTRRAPVSRPSS